MSMFLPFLGQVLDAPADSCAAQGSCSPFPFSVLQNQPVGKPRQNYKRQHVSVIANPPAQVKTGEDANNYYILLQKQSVQHPFLKFNNGFESFEIKYLKRDNVVTITIASALDEYKKSYEFEAGSVNERSVSWELMDSTSMLVKIPKVSAAKREQISREQKYSALVQELEHVKAELRKHQQLLKSQKAQFGQQLAVERRHAAAQREAYERRLYQQSQQFRDQQVAMELQFKNAFQEAAEIQSALFQQLEREQAKQTHKQPTEGSSKEASARETKPTSPVLRSRGSVLDDIDAAFAKFFESKRSAEAANPQNIVSIPISEPEKQEQSKGSQHDDQEMDVEDPPTSSLTEDVVSSTDESGPDTPDSSDNEDNDSASEADFVVVKKSQAPSGSDSPSKPAEDDGYESSASTDSKKRSRTPSLEDVQDEEFSAFSD
ncbi:unnamed protein product [Kuraishia capsulata CBS 1993]|uniref:Uncharacterized protein n=1 Tax=Kuraishia capsulata CBS 1993 TaxID=1382522 RepID=W6MTU4_9ASCO|nr:uncharacterized protein KUCA_T00004656001 [Kuraishia capsulata CBS 1993]CDK28672.1 unnamed protein product [Kuraishia capsulata CBS 1993]